jgi:hypothetical protein
MKVRQKHAQLGPRPMAPHLWAAPNVRDWKTLDPAHESTVIISQTHKAKVARYIGPNRVLKRVHIFRTEQRTPLHQKTIRSIITTIQSNC